LETNDEKILEKCSREGATELCIDEYIDENGDQAELWITSIKDREGNVVFYDVIGDHLDEIEAIITKVDDRMD